MKQIITSLPIIHIVAGVLLTFLYLARTIALIRNSKKAYSKAMLNASSFITLLLFFSGIIQAFLLKIPFSNSFVLIKIFGLLALTGLSTAAFMPRRKNTASLVLMGVSFVMLITIILVSTIMVPN